MIAIIITVIFGLIFAYLATQNTTTISIYAWNYAIHGAPIYLVILLSLAIGLLLATLIYSLKSITTSLKLGSKDDQLKKARQEITDLTKEVHKLEIENTKLKAEMGHEDTDDDSL